jgi:hypothetical protein
MPAKFTFFGGVFCAEPCHMAWAIRAAADWWRRCCFYIPIYATTPIWPASGLAFFMGEIRFRKLRFTKVKVFPEINNPLRRLSSEKR